MKKKQKNKLRLEAKGRECMVRPSRMYAAIRLAKMIHKVDGTRYAMALAISIYHVTWNYDKWSDEDHEWFWKNLREDEKEIPKKLDNHCTPSIIATLQKLFCAKRS